MTRVEAVDRAIQKAMSEYATYEQVAQAAIEANDTWLAEQIKAQDPVNFRRTKSPRIEQIDAITDKLLGND